MSSPPFFLRDGRTIETRARVKITPREKRRHTAGRVSPFLAWGDFHARLRFALALPTLRKNGGLLVV